LYLPLNRFFEAPQPSQNQQSAQSGFPFRRRQARNLSHDLPDRFSMVSQSRQDRNYIIPNFLALDEAISIQLSNVDNAIPEPHIRAAELAFHAKRRLAYIEQDLSREFAE
jgi:hypothetical protein